MAINVSKNELVNVNDLKLGFFQPNIFLIPQK